MKHLLSTNIRGHYAYIDTAKVVFLQQVKNHCTVHLSNKKKYTFYRSMKSMAPLFPDLVRVNVSLFINPEYLLEIQNKEGRLVWLTFEGWPAVPASRGESYSSFFARLSSNTGGGEGEEV